MQLINRLWKEEAGFVISSELVLIATLLVIGMLAGLTAVRDAVVQELGDIANAIGLVNQSYSFSGVTGHNSSTSGTAFNDRRDFCEDANADNNGLEGGEPACMSVQVPANTAG